MEFPAALREAQFRNYALANMFSLNAIWGQRTIVAWLAWDLTGSATWVGLIAFLNFVPTMISGPIFGALADRIDLRMSALAVQLSEMIITGALLALYVGGVLDIYVLAAVSLVFGVVISAHHPTRMALTPRLVPKSALANAVAISSLNFNFARLIGPARRRDQPACNLGLGAFRLIGADCAAREVAVQFGQLIAVKLGVSRIAATGRLRPR